MIEKYNLLNANYSTMQKELVRKGIHMTIAFIPALANINNNLTIILLVLGTSFYLFSEILRNSGHSLGFVSTISEIASRDRDKGLTLGPVTMALGVILVLSTFSPVAAACGIYALAFGDGLSSITGKLWGVKKIPFTGGKSLVGFFTCFTMILSTTYGVTGSFRKAMIAATCGALIELVPVKDVDNLLIPFVVALAVTI
jgi:phytol kinase